MTHARATLRAVTARYRTAELQLWARGCQVETGTDALHWGPSERGRWRIWIGDRPALEATAEERLAHQGDIDVLWTLAVQSSGR